jgi:iron complex transport system substrate-binding protein
VRRLLLALLVLVLVGCGGGGAEREEAAGAPPGYEPVVVENCGLEQTFERPPERAVTMNQHVTEVLLALGLEERMVGTAYLDDEILPELREAYERVPVLAEQYPSREVVLGTDTDFVFGGFESAFGPEAAGSREELHELGIGTYLMTEYCPDAAGEEKASFEQVYQDILTVGRIFGVEERAEEIVDEMESTVEETQRLVGDVEDPVRIAYIDGVDPAPFVAGGSGLADEVMRLAGAENVYSDLPDRFAESSWEEFVRREPEVVIIGHCCGDDPEDVRRGLVSNPALSELEAVREERFVPMGLSELVAGVRNAQAVRKLAGELYPEEFRKGDNG